MNSQARCEVCGAPAAAIRQSLFPIPASAAYCERCHIQGLEPLVLVQAYLALPDHERAERTPMTGGNHNLEQIAARSLAFAEVLHDQNGHERVELAP